MPESDLVRLDMPGSATKSYTHTIVVHPAEESEVFQDALAPAKINHGRPALAVSDNQIDQAPILRESNFGGRDQIKRPFYRGQLRNMQYYEGIGGNSQFAQQSRILRRRTEAIKINRIRNGAEIGQSKPAQSLRHVFGDSDHQINSREPFDELRSLGKATGHHLETDAAMNDQNRRDGPAGVDIGDVPGDRLTPENQNVGTLLSHEAWELFADLDALRSAIIAIA